MMMPRLESAKARAAGDRGCRAVAYWEGMIEYWLHTKCHPNRICTPFFHLNDTRFLQIGNRSERHNSRQILTTNYIKNNLKPSSSSCFPSQLNWHEPWASTTVVYNTPQKCNLWVACFLEQPCRSSWDVQLGALLRDQIFKPVNLGHYYCKPTIDVGIY